MSRKNPKKTQSAPPGPPDEENPEAAEGNDGSSDGGPEVLAIVSGKGGAGKSIVAGSLAYALLKAGHRVLLIDADLGTDGLSHFMLGEYGTNLADGLDEKNTLAWYVADHSAKAAAELAPIVINRRASSVDLGVDIHGIVSNRYLFGRALNANIPVEEYQRLSSPPTTKEGFKEAVHLLIDQLKKAGEYDYVIIDTRGGFAYQSADFCAFADGFILVSEPDITSMFQNMRLVDMINATAKEAGNTAVLRTVILNKASSVEGKIIEPNGENYDLKVDDIERGSRLDFAKALAIPPAYVCPIPFDMNAVKAYRRTSTPLRQAPWSDFSAFLLHAFTGLVVNQMRLWNPQRTEMWNDFVRGVEAARQQKKDDWLVVEEERQRFEADRDKRVFNLEFIEQQLKDTESKLTQTQEELAKDRDEWRIREDRLEQNYNQREQQLQKDAAEERQRFHELEKTYRSQLEESRVYLKSIETEKVEVSHQLDEARNEAAHAQIVAQQSRRFSITVVIGVFVLLMYIQYRFDVSDIFSRILGL